MEYYGTYRFKIPFFKYSNVKKVVEFLDNYVKLIELYEKFKPKTKIRKEIEEFVSNLVSEGLEKALKNLVKFVKEVEKIRQNIDKRIEKVRKANLLEHKDKYSYEIWGDIIIDFVDFRSIEDVEKSRGKYVIDDAHVDLALGYGAVAPRHFIVTTTRDRRKIAILVDKKFEPDFYMYKVAIPEKLVKNTGTVYKTYFKIYYKVGNIHERYSTLLTLVIRDNQGRYSILYPDQRDFFKPIQYLDMYCMGIVENYRQWKEIKDKIQLIEY